MNCFLGCVKICAVQVCLLIAVSDRQNLVCRGVVSSTPVGEEAYAEGCLGLVDDREVQKSLEKAKSKFKFCSDVGIGSRTVSTKSRIKSAIDDTSLDDLGVWSFSLNTDKKVQWVSDLYRDWWYIRCREPTCNLRIKWASLESIKNGSKANFCYAMCHFISEVRRRDGKEFPGKMLHEIVICMQFHLQKIGVEWKLLEGPDFVKLRHTVDNLMKQRTSIGVGKRMSAAPISLSQENVMWDKGVLGESTPTQLRDTVQYLLGVNLALRGGEEHKTLRKPGFQSQIEVLVDEEGDKYLLFTQDLKSKTSQGGLSSKLDSGRQVKVYGSENPVRNVVRLYEKYIGLLPQKAKHPDLFVYKLSERRRSPRVWYSDRPVGINVLKKTVKKLTTLAGLVGNFTNHSLRASCATRLYQSGEDEQTIKCITGHRSDTGVRLYKRILDDLLKSANKKICGETVNLEVCKKGRNVSSTVSKAPESPPATVDLISSDDSEIEIVKEVKKSETSTAHSRTMCRVSGFKSGCSPLCDWLKAVDKRIEKKKLKAKSRLSLSKKK